MKLLDVNLLLYAVNADAPNHAAAKQWLEASLSGRETIAFTWPVLLGFLRIGTRANIFPHPLPVAEAFRLIESWLARPNVVVLHPTQRHLGVLRGLLEPLGTAGNLSTDAHLAAIAIEHGAELCSMDRDFGRFEGLRYSHPLG